MTVPVNVECAIEDHSLRVHQDHLKDMGRVRERKYYASLDGSSPDVQPAVAGAEPEDTVAALGAVHDHRPR
ncbi:hypothetical protein GCM10023097_32120 [Streptomyces collinus]